MGVRFESALFKIALAITEGIFLSHKTQNIIMRGYKIVLWGNVQISRDSKGSGLQRFKFECLILTKKNTLFP